MKNRRLIVNTENGTSFRNSYEIVYSDSFRGLADEIRSLADSSAESAKEIRQIISDYMTTVMREEPLDPTLVDFDDDASW